MQQAIHSSDVEQFDKMADAWWDLNGVCKPLHQLNPFRLQYVMDRVNLIGKSVLDLGCGAGILSESLSKAGACVTAIDPAANLIDVAKEHARQGNLEIDYINADAAQYASCHQKSCAKKFDVITCMELLEHVADPGELIAICKNLLAKNGLVFFSTINRNIKAYALAIIAAEYMFKLLPIGTHTYAQFIKPKELATAIRQNKLELIDISGINYNPLCATVTLVASPSVNYLACAKYMVD
jgi:2-polyprenyl-6-hydroxyphenyl methylase/3-demethylubiquinone-9 3-methyltransferase